MPRDREIAALGARREGIVRRDQLLALGFSSDAIDHRVRERRLIVRYRGVYSLGPGRLSGRARLIAALDACGTGALLSHLTAAAQWEILQSSSARIDVTILGAGRRKPQGDIRLHQVRTLHSEDRAKHCGLPITSIARTLLDVAESEPESRLRRAFEEAERRRLLDMHAVNRLLERSHGRRGLRPLTALIASYNGYAPETRSELEARFADFCREHGIPPPAFNVEIEGFEVDAAWLKQKVVVELDSWAHHGDRSTFESDRVRDATLQLAGYRVLRITWRRLRDEPDAVAADIARALAPAA